MPTDREKWEFVDALVATDLGRIVVCNVVDGHAEGHLMKIDVKQYFEWWIDLCVHQRLRSITKILAAMGTLRNGKYPGTFKAGAKRPDFRFRCPKRRPRKQRRFQELCSTVPALVLREVIDDKTRDALKAKSIHFPATHSSDWTDDFIRTMMDIPDSLRTGRFGSGKSIGRSGSVWITGKPILDAKLNGYRQPADPARDVLGLVHRKPPDVLVALHFPWAVTDKVRFARPTFMDAGDHRRFRAQAGARHRRRMAAFARRMANGRTNRKLANALLGIIV